MLSPVCHHSSFGAAVFGRWVIGCTFLVRASGACLGESCVMSEHSIYYEVSSRPHRKAGWRVIGASQSREEALELARTSAARSPDAAAYVSKEIFDAEIGDFNSVRIGSFGDCDQVSAKPSKLDTNVVREVCLAPNDLLRADVRQLIGRLLERWLVRESLLPGELVMRPDMIERLDSAPHEISLAVQKAAVGRPDRNENVHSATRRINTLVEQAIEQVFKDARAGRFTRYPTEAGLAALVSQYSGDPHYEHRVQSAVADRLRNERDLRGKLGLLLDLWDEASGIGAPMEPAMRFVRELLAELCLVQGAFASMLGSRSSIGAEALGLARLLQPDRDAITSDDLMERFSAGIRSASWPGVRRTVIGRLIDLLAMPRRLAPSSLEDELTTMRRIADAVARFADPSELESLTEAFARRSRLLVTAHSLDPWVAGLAPREKLARLLSLGPHLVGPGARVRLSQHIAAWLGGPSFLEEVQERESNLFRQLQLLRELDTELERARSDAAISDALTATLEGVALRLLAIARPFEKIAAATSDPVKAAAAILTLAARDLPVGACQAEALTKVRELLRRPESRRLLAATPQLAEELARLGQGLQTNLRTA